MGTTDHLGSPSDIMDAGGSLLARYSFDPFGRRTLAAGNDVSDLTVSGFSRAPDLELAYAVHRAYDPNLGRWLSPDPIGLTGGSNLYAYVDNKPVSEVDPLGWAIAKPCGWTYVGVGGILGDVNNQVIFCAKCDRCETPEIKGVRFGGNPPSGPGEPPAGLARVPSTPTFPLSTLDRCACSGGNKVYVNIQTRRALHPVQYLWSTSKVTLEYECRP